MLINMVQILGKYTKILKTDKKERLKRLKNINKELKKKLLEEIVKPPVIYPEGYPEVLLPKEKFGIQIE